MTLSSRDASRSQSLLHVASMRWRRDGRRCAEEKSRFPVPAMGKTPHALAGQAYDPVQYGAYVTGGFSAVDPGNWD